MNPIIFSPHATMYDLQVLRERLAVISRSRSESTADILARMDWFDQRLAAIEAHLGIVAPSPPMPANPEEADIISAIEQLEKESPDPTPLQNNSNGLT